MPLGHPQSLMHRWSRRLGQSAIGTEAIGTHGPPHSARVTQLSGLWPPSSGSVLQEPQDRELCRVRMAEFSPPALTYSSLSFALTSTQGHRQGKGQGPDGALRRDKVVYGWSWRLGPGLGLTGHTAQVFLSVQWALWPGSCTGVEGHVFGAWCKEGL